MLMLALLQVFATQTTMPIAPPTAVRSDPPFGVGEVLVYDAKVSLFGRVGEATLRVDEGCRVADRKALRLSFDVSGGAAFFRVEDATRSWVDASTLATLRYEKTESSPLGSHRESVSLHPAMRQWEDEDGRMFETAASLPVDELSLLYYVRTLPLEHGDVKLGAGHFDARRNPIALRVVGRGSVEVSAGRFDVIEVELRVRDPRRYRGTGVVRLDLTDDAHRTPVRIRTALPGSTPVTLELRDGSPTTAAAPACT